MNVGCLLQFERDARDDHRAGAAVTTLLDWLEHNWLDHRTGMWGGLDVDDPIDRSHLVQAAYHLWPIFAFDGREIPARRTAITTVLATQNDRGGFGWGVHNAERPAWSSACEDIDSIEPLARYGATDPAFAGPVHEALARALVAVLQNRNADGGFVFIRGADHWYGHATLAAERDESSLFSTWFRTLSLAYLGQALPGSLLDGIRWRFCGAPGMQFAATTRCQ